MNSGVLSAARSSNEYPMLGRTNSCSFVRIIPWKLSLYYFVDTDGTIGACVDKNEAQFIFYCGEIVSFCQELRSAERLVLLRAVIDNMMMSKLTKLKGNVVL